MLTHLLAFLLGFIAAFIVARYAAPRLKAQQPRPLSRRRLAIRRANADDLPRRDPDWIAQVNAIVQEM